MKNSGSGIVPQHQRAIAVDPAFVEFCQCFRAVVFDVRRAIDREIQSASQHLARFHVQLAHQRRAPAVHRFSSSIMSATGRAR
jgi:hypothetical protein